MELLDTFPGQIIAAVFVGINLFSFFVMARDKQKARRRDNSRRTPEGLMFFMAAAFGGIGVFLGMKTFRHKTKTWYFQIGIPLLILQNVATVYVVWELMVS